MNHMLIAAVCGFLFRELLAVANRDDRSVPLNPLYYLRHNLLLILLNIVGTVGLYFTIPDLLALQARYLGGEHPLLTGFAIGLMGAWMVRKIQDVIKAKVDRHTEDVGD
jgi:hypothetical protein